MTRFVTRALIVMAAILGIAFAQVAPASATTTKNLESDLAALWTGVLETPRLENPFVGGGPECWDLGNRTIAQFSAVNEKKCTVKPGTKNSSRRGQGSAAPSTMIVVGRIIRRVARRQLHPTCSPVLKKWTSRTPYPKSLSTASP
jgi:hypothetical protein